MAGATAQKAEAGNKSAASGSRAGAQSFDNKIVYSSTGSK